MRKKYLKFLNSILVVTVFSSLSFFAYPENTSSFGGFLGGAVGGGEVPVGEATLRNKEVGKSLNIFGISIPA